MSRYKVDRSREFIPGYKVGGGHWRSVAVQIVSKPEICQDAGFRLRADARVQGQRPLRICLGCRNIRKKCDKQLTFIVRVMCWPYFLLSCSTQIRSDVLYPKFSAIFKYLLLISSGIVVSRDSIHKYLKRSPDTRAYL